MERTKKFGNIPKELSFRVKLDKQTSGQDVIHIILELEKLGYESQISDINGDIGFYK